MPWAAAFADVVTVPGQMSAHRGSPTSEDELRAIAAVYLKAFGEGRPVTDAVAKHFHVSKSTAGKRIMRARAAGLLDGAKRITR
jgi:transposase